MRKNNTIIAFFAGLITSILIGLYSFNLSAEVSVAPRVEIEETLDELVDTAEALKGDDKKAERRQKMRQIIETRFDFVEMSKRSLGAEWKKASEAERDEFIKLFSELLANTYIGKVDMIERGMVKVVDAAVHEDKSLIKTLVNYKDDKFGLDYKLLNREGKWKVYDVIIENIGLVANYRNEFSGIIRKEKFSGLLEKLKKKVDKKVT
jgi:phospholipid transport system substrate-binding protein